MNYYERHLGDYARDTGHLSLLEHGVYGLLLDRYYATEEPIPADQVYRLARARTDDERAAVDAVLAEFFVLDGAVWRNGRCDSEVAKYEDKRSKAKASAAARWADKPSECERNANAMRTHSDGNAHQSPVTSHQQKQKTKAGQLALPEWLSPEVWRDWSDYRNSRKGWTAKAKQLSLRTLADLWADGHDPRCVVDAAIERGWTGLFAPRATARAGPQPQQSKTLTAIQTLQGMKSNARPMAARPDSGRTEPASLPLTGTDARR